MAEINLDGVPKKGNYNRGGTTNMGPLRGFFTVRKGTNFLTTAQLSDLQTNIQAKLVNDDEKARSIMVGTLGAKEENGEDVQYETVELFKNRVNNGTIDSVYTLIKGTFAEFRQLLNAIDGKDFDVVPFDENNRIWFLRTATGIKGIPTHALEMKPWKDPVSGETVKYKVRLAFADQADLTERASHLDLNFAPMSDLKGVEGIELENFTNALAAGLFDVKVKGSAGHNNLADLYQGASELKQPSAWVAVNKDGGGITISSVGLTMDGTTVKGFRFTFDTADPQYTAGQPIYLKTAAISAVFTILSSYFETTEPLVLTAS